MKIPFEKLKFKKYNRLTIMEELPSRISGGQTRRRFKCVCDCGKERDVDYDSLKSGNVMSCGCYFSEMMSKLKTKHGENRSNKKRSAEYGAWSAMRSRCYNINSKSFERWGGRGIIVCERWKHSFPNFLEDMGRRPTKKHSLDRYPDNDGNYEPSNCRWATRKQQAQNRSSSRWIECNGEKKVLIEWARELKIHNSSLIMYLKETPMELIVAKYELKNQLDSINKKYAAL